MGDKLGRLTQLDNGDIITAYTYDKNGNVLTKSSGGFTTEYAYNKGNLITGLTNKYSDSALSAYAYGYSLDGNKVWETSADGTEKNYTYDLLGRLVNEVHTGDQQKEYTYAYDRFGNRSSLIENGQTTTYEYDLNNRLIASYTGNDGVYYSYDANGNQILSRSFALTEGEEGLLQVTTDTPDFKAYEYDLFNRLVRFNSGGNITGYTYHADGLRKSKTANNLATSYTWDRGNMVAETTPQNTTIYEYDLQGVSRRITGTDSDYYLKNSHGDVVGLYNADGTAVSTYTYDAFGNQLDGCENDTNPFRYCGEYFDEETDSIYLRNRYYVPQTGRFITEDPIRDGLNWYVYCANNPINFVDPTGYAKDGDEKFSQSVRDEIAVFGQMWSDAEVAYTLGIINVNEKEAVQYFAEAKADEIRYRAEHPYKTFFSGAVEFAVFEFALGELSGGTVYAADLSGPALEKMYGNQENLKAIVDASPIVAVVAVNSSSKGRTLVNTKINGKMTRVDIEFPQGGKPANLHVQIKETGQKVMIESLDDLSKLPKAVSKNTAIINTVKKGLKLLGKLF